MKRKLQLTILLLLILSMIFICACVSHNDNNDDENQTKPSEQVIDDPGNGDDPVIDDGEKDIIGGIVLPEVEI